MKVDTSSFDKVQEWIELLVVEIKLLNPKIVITKNMLLDRVILKDNGIILDLSGLDILELPYSLTQIDNLKTLKLQYNNIHTFPEFMCYVDELEELNLSFNSLHDLPNSFVKLKNLNYLAIRFNPITKLPDLSNMRNLRVFDTDKIYSKNTL